MPAPAAWFWSCIIAVIIPLQSLVVAQFVRGEFSDAVALSFLAALVLAGNTRSCRCRGPARRPRDLGAVCVLLTCYVYRCLDRARRLVAQVSTGQGLRGSR
jgi:hypothetical protein